MRVPNLPCGVERLLFVCMVKALRYVPNLPCGVERRSLGIEDKDLKVEFLIYRVELKVALSFNKILSFNFVPNLPCGVESFLLNSPILIFILVPNLPCGVESQFSQQILGNSVSVPNLPCGVERTSTRRGPQKQSLKVPNLPCGVESFRSRCLLRCLGRFLIYRVELKALYKVCA